MNEMIQLFNLKVGWTHYTYINISKIRIKFSKLSVVNVNGDLI